MVHDNSLENLKKGKKTQWQPGESGNPDGKPKGTRHVSTWIREMMEDETFEQKLKDGTILRGAPIQAVLKTAIAKSMSGDPRFLDILFKYGYGQKIDLTSGDKPIPILGGSAARPKPAKRKE